MKHVMLLSSTLLLGFVSNVAMAAMPSWCGYTTSAPSMDSLKNDPNKFLKMGQRLNMAVPQCGGAPTNCQSQIGKDLATWSADCVALNNTTPPVAPQPPKGPAINDIAGNTMYQQKKLTYGILNKNYNDKVNACQTHYQYLSTQNPTFTTSYPTPVVATDASQFCDKTNASDQTCLCLAAYAGVLYGQNQGIGPYSCLTAAQLSSYKASALQQVNRAMTMGSGQTQTGPGGVIIGNTNPTNCSSLLQASAAAPTTSPTPWSTPWCGYVAGPEQTLTTASVGQSVLNLAASHCGQVQPIEKSSKVAIALMGGATSCGLSSKATNSTDRAKYLEDCRPYYNMVVTQTAPAQFQPADYQPQP